MFAGRHTSTAESSHPGCSKEKGPSEQCTSIRPRPNENAKVLNGAPGFEATDEGRNDNETLDNF